MNDYDEARECIEQIIRKQRALDWETTQNINALSRLIVGKLQLVDHATLKKIKRELSRYNMHTGRWKDL